MVVRHDFCFGMYLHVFDRTDLPQVGPITSYREFRHQANANLANSFPCRHDLPGNQEPTECFQLHRVLPERLRHTQCQGVRISIIFFLI